MSTIKVSITGSNVARDNHWEIPTGSITPVRTLLIEAGPRRNRATTQSINLADWTLNAVTRTSSFAEAPDGTMTATFIKETTANTFHYFQIASSVGTNTLTGTSIFLKPVGRTRFYVGLNDTSGAYALADITLTGTGSVNGTVVNGTAAIPTIRIVPYSGSWYRVDVVARAASFGNPPFQIQILSASSNSYTGNGTSGVYVWGYQDNDWNRGSEIYGIAPSMFIRGEGTQTGSRDRDVIYWTAPVPQPMTVYIRGIVQGNTLITSERKIIQFGNYAVGGVHAGISTNGAALENTVRTQFISNYRTATSTVTPFDGILPGHAVELSMRLYNTGSGVGTQISYALNDGTVQTGNSSSIESTAFPSIWNVINSMSLCTSDSFTQYSQAFAFRNILIATGSKTLEEMRALIGLPSEEWSLVAADTIPTRGSDLVGLTTYSPSTPLSSGWTAYNGASGSYNVRTWGAINANIANPGVIYSNASFDHTNIRFHVVLGRYAIDRTGTSFYIGLYHNLGFLNRLYIIFIRTGAGGGLLQLRQIDAAGVDTQLGSGVAVSLGVSQEYLLILEISDGMINVYENTDVTGPLGTSTRILQVTLPSQLASLSQTQGIWLQASGATTNNASHIYVSSNAIWNKV